MRMLVLIILLHEYSDVNFRLLLIQKFKHNQSEKIMRLNTLLLGATVFLVSNLAIAQDKINRDQKQLHAIVHTFKEALKNKNAAKFSNLFYDSKIPWIAVFSKEMHNQKSKTKPNYPRTVNFGSYRTPAEMLAGDEDREEKIANVKIDSDGYLAWIHFDYEDYLEGVKQAYGTEAWSLIKDGEHWKIVSVTYTVTEAVIQ